MPAPKPSDLFSVKRARARLQQTVSKPSSNDIPKDIWKVGIFVNESPARIEEIGAQLNLDIAQLHGAETPEQHPRGLRVWKAFRVTDGRIPEQMRILLKQFSSMVPRPA